MKNLEIIALSLLSTLQAASWPLSNLSSEPTQSPYILVAATKTAPQPKSDGVAELGDWSESKVDDLDQEISFIDQHITDTENKIDRLGDSVRELVIKFTSAMKHVHPLEKRVLDQSSGDKVEDHFDAVDDAVDSLDVKLTNVDRKIDRIINAIHAALYPDRKKDPNISARFIRDNDAGNVVQTKMTVGLCEMRLGGIRNVTASKLKSSAKRANWHDEEARLSNCHSNVKKELEASGMFGFQPNSKQPVLVRDELNLPPTLLAE